MTRTVPVPPSRGSQASGGDRGTATSQCGQDSGQGSRGGSGSLTQSERVREGFVGERRSERYRTRKDPPDKEGETSAQTVRIDSEAHS